MQLTETGGAFSRTNETLRMTSGRNKILPLSQKNIILTFLEVKYNGAIT